MAVEWRTMPQKAKLRAASGTSPCRKQAFQLSSGKTASPDSFLLLPVVKSCLLICG